VASRASVTEVFPYSDIIMTIYCISGLGADYRVFQKLVFPSDYHVVHVEWIQPEIREALSSYALRLLKQIDNSKPFILIGLSFGGMVASELLKSIQPVKTIIISSATTKYQIPWYFRFLGQLRLQYLIPNFIFKQPNFIFHWIFSAKDIETKQMLEGVLHDTNPRFVKWSMTKIITWQQSERCKNIFHIHGTKDRLLPIDKGNVDAAIEGGGHLMVYDRSEAVSAMINMEI
jgi:pimeloyl-ACP methyl ester carboxylesterase